MWKNNRTNKIMLNISYLYYFDDKEDDRQWQRARKKKKNPI